VRDPSRFVRFRHGSLQRNGFHAFCLVIGHRHHLESGQYLSAMFQLTVRELSGLVFPDLSTRNLMGWRISPVVWRTSLASATESPVSRPAYCLASNEGTNPVSPYSVTKPGGYQLANNCLVKRNTCCLHVGLFCQIQINSNWLSNWSTKEKYNKTRQLSAPVYEICYHWYRIESWITNRPSHQSSTRIWRTRKQLAVSCLHLIVDSPYEWSTPSCPLLSIPEPDSCALGDRSAAWCPQCCGFPVSPTRLCVWRRLGSRSPAVGRKVARQPSEDALMFSKVDTCRGCWSKTYLPIFKKLLSVYRFFSSKIPICYWRLFFMFFRYCNFLNARDVTIFGPAHRSPSIQ